MAITFDEDYFNSVGYKNYSDYPHFQARAQWIATNLEVKDGVMILGGGLGYTAMHLQELGIKAAVLEVSQYCFDNKVIENFYLNPTEVKWNDYDWIVSWNVLDCLSYDTVDLVCEMLNSFKGQQLHILCCAGHESSERFINSGYFIQSHDYWRTKLPTANLVCYDCEATILGNVSKVPLCWGLVSE